MSQADSSLELEITLKEYYENFKDELSDEDFDDEINQIYSTSTNPNNQWITTINDPQTYVLGNSPPTIILSPSHVKTIVKSVSY
jgi:hypothetical protein